MIRQRICSKQTARLWIRRDVGAFGAGRDGADASLVAGEEKVFLEARRGGESDDLAGIDLDAVIKVFQEPVVFR